MKRFVLASIAAVLSMSVACSKSPGVPSESFTAPIAAQPSNGASIKFNAQPVTLTVTNAVSTGTATATYTVEVATDTGFANKVFTKSGIAQGTGTTTTVPVTMTLPGSTNYYWHSMTVVDGVTGAPSTPQQFTVGPQVVLNTPTVSSPANGASLFTVSPTFVVNNATRTGPAGPISYLFQVSTSSSFSPLAASATVPEQSGATTSWTPSSALPAGTLYWQVAASDPSDGLTTSFTSGVSFQAGIFDMTQATMEDNPPGVPTWAQTAHIASIVFTPISFEVDFDLRTGPNQWPESGFGDGGIQYTLGMCGNISNHWYCSAVVQFWTGRDLDASGDPSQIAQSWFYDSRWGALQGYQPNWGDQVGVFVAQGNLRDSGNTSLFERSDVVVIPWGQNYLNPNVVTYDSLKKTTAAVKLPAPVLVKH